ncbi:MAG: DUF3341 domain-containing protein [Aureliella sp.]
MSEPFSPRAWGALAQFSSAKDLEHAVSELSGAEKESVEAFAPFPLDPTADMLYQRRSPLPVIIAAGGVIGGGGMYAFQYWVSAIAYPLNVGGRPLHSWPAFIPATFELTVLTASIFALVGLILRCGLPRLHHPLFEVEAFKRASVDGFFLAVHREYSDRAVFEEITQRYRSLGATDVWEVPNA